MSRADDSQAGKELFTTLKMKSSITEMQHMADEQCIAAHKRVELEHQVFDALLRLNCSSARLEQAVTDKLSEQQEQLSRDTHDRLGPASNESVVQGGAAANASEPITAGCSACSKLHLALAERDATYQALLKSLAAQKARQHDLEEMLDGSEETRWGLVQQLGDREHACHILSEQLETERHKVRSLKDEMSNISCKIDGSTTKTDTQSCVASKGALITQDGLIAGAVNNETKRMSFDLPRVYEDGGAVACTSEAGRLAVDSHLKGAVVVESEASSHQAVASNEWLLVDPPWAQETCPTSAVLAAAGEALHIDIKMSTWQALPEEVRLWLLGLTVSDGDGLNIDVELESWDELPAVVQQWIACMQLSQSDGFVFAHPVQQQAQSDGVSFSSQALQEDLSRHLEVAVSDVESEYAVIKANNSRVHRSLALKQNNDLVQGTEKSPKHCSDLAVEDCNNREVSIYGVILPADEAQRGADSGRDDDGASSDMSVEDDWTVLGKPQFDSISA